MEENCLVPCRNFSISEIFDKLDLEDQLSVSLKLVALIGDSGKLEAHGTSNFGV